MATNESSGIGFNQEQADAIRRQNEQLEIQAKNLKDFRVSHDKILSIQSRQLQNLAEMGNLLGDMGEQTRAWADSQAKVAERYSSTFALQETWFTKTASYVRDIAESEKNRQKAQEELNEYLAEQGENYENIIRLIEQEEKAQARLEEAEIRKKELQEKQIDLTVEEQEELKKLNDEVEELTNEYYNTLVASEHINKETRLRVKLHQDLEKTTKNINKEAVKAAGFKALEKSGEIISKAGQGFAKIQGIGAQMYKATGGMTDTIDSVQATFMENGPIDLADMGIGFENISESMINLSQRSGKFAAASREVQKEVGLTATKLERLGISSDTTADLLNTLTLNFDGSATDFENMADTFVDRASDIGMSVQQYTQDFQASYPVLSRYGADAVNVFDKLSRQARASGLSVQELAQSMGQFDTFQGAAENASKLNFLLGSQLDTTQLLMADEAERLDMIKGAFSPEQFANMDKFKKKAIAAAAGFSDVGAFEKAMKGDVDALGDIAKDQQEKLDDAVRKSTSAQESYSKSVENVKDQVAIAMMGTVTNISGSVGTMGKLMFAGTQLLGSGLGSLAGIIQMSTNPTLGYFTAAVKRAATAALTSSKTSAAGGAADVLPTGGTGGGTGKFSRFTSGATKFAGRAVAGASISLIAESAGDALKASGNQKGGLAVDMLGDIGGAAMMGAQFGPWGMAAGALVGAGYSLYENWDEVTSAFGDITEEQRKLTEKEIKAKEEQRKDKEEADKEKIKLLKKIQENGERQAKIQQATQNFSQMTGKISSNRNPKT